MAPEKQIVIGGDCLERFAGALFGLDEAYDVSYEFLDNWMQADPILVAQCGLDALAKGDLEEKVEPVYLRGADVSQSKTPPRQLEGSI